LRTISSANSSRTSSITARSSDPSTPEPSSRSRKSARPPKRQPPGAPDESARARCSDPPPDALLHGIEEFNAGDFFEQHETLELLWRDTAAPVRGLYHGILQVGVGFHHLRRGNFHGASVLLEEGIDRLRPFAPTCQTIDVAALIDDATAARQELLALGSERMSEFDLTNAPRVRFAR
jgi:predicted metal-dependent hydrolase